ncbi:MAG: cobalt ECF transporter T component CbiQ [Drouetiella hepatica Uher 2000/2452]|jgi:cobalt/nickel transport system permease protein|uniref:Cobalt ECF transporter T component CbiQ n=1 Tax=Drouetiella hepatica Uher 2000/2452 TaxID=904376 RepID=A0A951UN77_9CYAN|nr:cobalt ECF transporter T component CbiQ [Drouetiella hepatica Uher 2000/2452]
MLLHIGAFQLDVNSQGNTPWHGLAPRTRVLFALLFVFATALTPNERWGTWLIYAVGLMGLIILSRAALSVLLKRVAVESSFISVVLLGTLFRGGGTVLWQWGWLQITSVGLAVLGSVTTKALLCLLMLNLLVLTTSIPALLHALAELKMPSLLVAILASMYRYIGVLIEEFATMRRAAASRNLLSTARGKRLVTGNMIGSLFIRTYERGERVHHAMLSRGYTGLPPTIECPQGRLQDRWAIVTWVILLLLGQVVYFL